LTISPTRTEISPTPAEIVQNPDEVIETPAEIVQNPDKIIETPAEITPPAADITPLERGGLMLETEQTPLESEPPPPVAAVTGAFVLLSEVCSTTVLRPLGPGLRSSRLRIAHASAIRGPACARQDEVGKSCRVALLQ
jgi:hypothetical protein